MLKLFGIRTWIGLTAMLVAGGAILVMQDRLSAWWATGQVWSTLAKDHGDWRQHELVFLKQAYDRLEAQRRALPGTAPASLRNEQQEILRRMTQTANPIRDKIPPEIAALLPDQPAAQAEPEKPAPQAAPVASKPTLISAPAPVELRVGAVAFPGVDLDLSSLSRDLELDQVMDRVQKIRKPHPAKPADDAAKSTTAETSGSAKQ
jgi:hypothetical protein